MAKQRRTGKKAASAASRVLRSGRTGKDSKKEKTRPADGEWHVFALDTSSGSAKGELDRMRFGMWEPEGYLAAGIGGNHSGAWYEVKLFPTPGAATRFCRWGASEDPF